MKDVNYTKIVNSVKLIKSNRSSRAELKCEIKRNISSKLNH